MGPLFCPSLILLLSLCVALISPTHSFNCSSLELPGGEKQYSNCTELPTLNSTLHFTYNASNSSLSVAFSAAPPNANGWVAWAINPTGTGMVGSQTLLAYKNNGSMVVKTYKISSYSSVEEGKLSFEVWNLSAEAADDGKMVIYGSLKVPTSPGKLNQVWQVGPGVIGGHPMKHEFAEANLESKQELDLEKASSGASSTPSAAAQAGKVNAGLWILCLVSLPVLM